MTATAILLILISAVIHASWNLLSKRSRPTAAFFLAAVITSAVVYAPVGWIFREALPHYPSQVWGFLALTGAFQALYYAGLAGAYRVGELSVVYPLARALPVLLVAGGSFILGRGEQITPAGLLGMVLVAGGCWLVPQQSLFNAQAPRTATPSPTFHPKNRAVLWAVLAAASTTGYTLTDDTALVVLRAVPAVVTAGSGSIAAVTLLYTFMENCAILVWLGGYVLVNRVEQREIRSLRWRGWLKAFIAGVLILAAYGLVLVAMAYVRDVSYVAAFRQVSIPLGAILGLLVEKEKAYPAKLVGIACIAVGLTLVAIG